MNPNVTIFMSLSGRWHLWERRIQWLRRQKYPRGSLSISLLCTDPAFKGWPHLLRIDDLFGWASWKVGHRLVGRPGLADDPKRTDSEVYRAMSEIYSLAIGECQTDYLMVLEDDVFCDDLDLVEKLLKCRGEDPKFFSVSVPYRHRSMPDRWCAWEGTTHGIRFLDVSDELLCEFCGVDGHGLGCCLMDARQAYFALPEIMRTVRSSGHFDLDLFNVARSMGWKSFLAGSLQADHEFSCQKT